MRLSRQLKTAEADSLQHELRRTYLGIAMFAAFIVAGSLLVMATLVLRSYASQNLELVARSISYTVEAAVVFHDDFAAQEAIEHAAIDGEVADIEVIYQGGQPAAHWRMAGDLGWTGAARWCAWVLLPAQVVAPIKHGQMVLGEVRVIGDGHRLLAYIAGWLLGIGVCLCVSTAGALYLAHRMLRDIETPLRNLAQVAHGARTRRELSRRVPPARITELRSLGDDFNGLMAELEAWEHHMRRENALLSYQAHHDKLTGVYNRAQFEKVLDGLLRSSRPGVDGFGLLFIDCDNFKQINDGHGHDVGDQALIHVSALIRDNLRSGDVVGRLGGDEFAVLMPPPYAPGDAVVLARTLVAATRAPMVTSAGGGVQVSFSIGTAQYPQDGLDARSLMACADIDMYNNKRSGGGFPARFRFRPSLNGRNSLDDGLSDDNSDV